MQRILLAFMLVLTVSVNANTYSVDNLPNPKTADSRTYVSNPDGILQQNTVQEINNKLLLLDRKTRVQVALVVVSSIGGEDINQFAESVFKKWKIGYKKQSTGLLILFVLDEKKVDFETGYGLEGMFTDYVCKHIQTEQIIPHFKNGDYDAGMLAAVDKIVTIASDAPFKDESAVPVRWDEIIPVVLAVFVFFMLLCFIWVNSLLVKIKNNTKLNSNISRYTAFRSQKNGAILSFAVVITLLGILFSIVSGNLIFGLLSILLPITVIPANLFALTQLRKLRKQPIPCQHCDGTMHLLSEKEEDAYLSISQQYEEQLHAIDYDVFVCNQCKNKLIYTLDKPSMYTECPQCKTKAYTLSDKKIIVAPTHFSTGIERITYKCSYCGYEENNNQKLPRVPRTDDNSLAKGIIIGSILGNGGFGSSDGNFGGGGFGDSGSFGGGDSGGGGATSGW